MVPKAPYKIQFQFPFAHKKEYGRVIMKRKTRRKAPVRKSRSSSIQGIVRVFRGIGTLYTLEKAVQKSGRKILRDDLSEIDRAALIVIDDRVVWSGLDRLIPKQYARKNTIEADLKDACVMPAFVEPHTHLIFAGNRAHEFERRNQGESYQSIGKSGGGILATVLPTRAAAIGALAKVGQERVERFLRQGVTTIEVKSGYGLTVESELKILRAAGRLKRARIVRTFLGAHAIPREAKSAEDYVNELIRNAFPKIAKEGLASRADVFIEDGYFSKDLSRKYLSAAKEHGLEVVMHADQLTRSGGAELAVELCARSADHLLQVNENDVARLSASDVTCVLLPSADLYMKSSYPPARELIDQGARVALSTDFNPGSAPSQDIALTGVLARVQMHMTLAEVVAAYTVGGAHALGLGHEIGALVVGMSGDFLVLKNSVDELFLEVGGEQISRVYSKGVRLI